MEPIVRFFMAFPAIVYQLYTIVIAFVALYSNFSCMHIKLYDLNSNVIEPILIKLNLYITNVVYFDQIHGT